MDEKPYYISKDDLLKLIDKYQATKQDDKELKGFAFRLGKDENQQDSLFPDPLFSNQEIGDKTVDVILKNSDTAKGCPYPPGYPRLN